MKYLLVDAEEFVETCASFMGSMGATCPAIFGGTFYHENGTDFAIGVNSVAETKLTVDQQARLVTELPPTWVERS